MKEAEELNASLPVHDPSLSYPGSSGLSTGVDSVGTSLPSIPSGSTSSAPGVHSSAATASTMSLESGHVRLRTSISRETFVFARFSIHCRAGDIHEAAESLRELIVEATSFEMALNALVMFLQGSGVVSTEICQGKEIFESCDGSDMAKNMEEETAEVGLGGRKRDMDHNHRDDLLGRETPTVAAALQYLDFFQLLGEKFNRFMSYTVTQFLVCDEVL